MACEFIDFDGLQDHEKQEILSFIDPLKRFVKLPWDNYRRNSLQVRYAATKMPQALDVFEFKNDLDYNNSGVILNGNARIEQTFHHNGQITDNFSSNVMEVKTGLMNKSHLNERSMNVSEINSSSSNVDKISCNSKSVEVCESDFVHFNSTDQQTESTNFCNVKNTTSLKSFHSNVPSLSKTELLNEDIDSTFENKREISCTSLVNNSKSDNEVDFQTSNYDSQTGIADEFSPKKSAEVPLSINLESDINGNNQECKTFNVVNSSPEHKMNEEKDLHYACTPKIRSFADVLRNNNKMCETEEKRTVNENPINENISNCSTDVTSNVIDDKLAFTLGKYFINMELDFSPISLQPRGLINRRNWCYINATLQALLACPPFYRLLINMPSLPANKRGKSSTPVIDSMVHFASHFQQITMSQEDFKAGAPFQPSAIYEMLGNIKSDCSKGQQEDAEEFLSFLLNVMQEEITFVTKHYQQVSNHTVLDGVNGNVDNEADEEGWQVIGAKQRGMITRKVVEHKTPISDLLGGQIVSLLTTNGKTTMSASVQPFFTLQLDIQATNVNTLEEALLQMTFKEAIQGYTCSKTKQEVEAFCKILLQKLPPILILHLKRFIYDKDGGCKKVMKHTQYPMVLDLKKDLFSSELRKKKLPSYRLFAVMYHEGEEAIKGHYVSDIYHPGCSNWIRCDDRKIFVIPETNVLSHSPPRVPYLLFYQMTNFECNKI